MKNFLKCLIVLAVCIVFIQASEDENNWIYRVNYLTTEDCPDSVNCFTEVKVDINMQRIPDSAFMKLKIGPEFGSETIFSQQYLNAASLTSEAGVVADSTGLVTITLGKYLIDGPFFIDMEVIERVR